MLSINSAVTETDINSPKAYDAPLLSDSVRMQTKESMANRPDNTAFTQQRLPAWQPILSAGIVIPGFTFIGLAFIGIGVALFVTSQNIKVLEVGEKISAKSHTSIAYQLRVDVVYRNRVYTVFHLDSMFHLKSCKQQSPTQKKVRMSLHKFHR